TGDGSGEAGRPAHSHRAPLLDEPNVRNVGEDLRRGHRGPADEEQLLGTVCCLESRCGQTATKRSPTGTSASPATTVTGRRSPTGSGSCATPHPWPRPVSGEM